MEICNEFKFALCDKHGFIQVNYKTNNSPYESGFNHLKGLSFNPSICIGYPTMKAAIIKYEGTGYAQSCAWIQIITDEFYETNEATAPTRVVVEVDVDDKMRELGVPFFGYGYPSEIYDAPCNNLGNYKRLIWSADTFLVTYPSRINDNTVSFLAGFSWGYIESDVNGIRNIELLPLQEVKKDVWIKYKNLLETKFPEWKYK